MMPGGFGNHPKVVCQCKFLGSSNFGWRYMVKPRDIIRNLAVTQSALYGFCRKIKAEE